MTDLAAQPKQPNWFSRLAHPGAFMAWSKPLLWPLAILTALCFAAGLYFGLVDSPPDYQMGETVRIMYVHVPNAWLSQFVYGVMFVAALGTLVWRHPLADVAQKAAAPLGAAFTALALYSGSLWGRPTWGTFWEWDGRMTSTLILLFIYLGIIALWRAFDDQTRAAPHRRRGDAGRRARHSGGQIFGRLVEHAAPAGEHHLRQLEAPRRDVAAAVHHAVRLHLPVPVAPHRLDPHRDLEAPRRDHEPAGRRRARLMETHAQDVVFVVWAYVGVGLVTLGLIAGVWMQAARARAKLAALEAQGIRRRSAGTPT